MIRKIVIISILSLFLQASIANAGATGSENLSSSNKKDSASECFEGFSRAMFKFNHGLDKALFEPIAKGYRAIPAPIRKGTGKFCQTGYEKIFDGPP